MTDESNVYAHPGSWFASRETVNHSAKEYVRGDVYTNTVEGYFSILKRGIYGVYQHVSEAHLHRYLSEFDFRYSNRSRMGIEDKARADLALVGAKGKRLTYRTVGGSDQRRLPRKSGRDHVWRRSTHIDDPSQGELSFGDDQR